MRIKKILASVLAAAIAVSATAISVSAADLVKDIKNDTTVHNATITMNVEGTLKTAGTDLVFTAEAPTGEKADTILKTSVELKIVTNKGTIAAPEEVVSTVTKSADKSDVVTFTTGTGVGFKDITKVADGAAYQATITILVENTTADYAAAKIANYTVKVANDADGDKATTGIKGSDTNGKVVVNDDTSRAGTVTGHTFNANDYTLAQRAQIKDATGVKLTLNFNKASSLDNNVVTLSKGEKAYAVKVPAKGDTSVTFDLPVSDFYSAEFAAFDAPAFTFAITGGGDATSIESASITFVAAEEPEETTTTEEEEETTTEAPEETTTEAPEETSVTADDIDEPADTGAAALVVAPAIISAIATIISKKRK